MSICIPTFNGARHLAACIESVEAQTYERIEIVVVDDCSSDETPELVAEWARRDGRVRVASNARNVGLVGNWNRCVSLVTGEWVKFVFQDDTLEPACVEKLLSATLPGHRFAACERTIVYDGVDAAQRGHVEAETARLSLRGLVEDSCLRPEQLARLALQQPGRNAIGEPTVVLLHRSVFEEFGTFNPDLVHQCDLEYWLRVGLTTGVAWVGEPLATFRVHPGAASRANFVGDAFRAGRLDPLVLLHEYLFNPHFRLVREVAEEHGGLDRLRRKLRADALRAHLRAELDARLAPAAGGRSLQQWHATVQRYPRLRPPGDRAVPVAAALLAPLDRRRRAGR